MIRRAVQKTVESELAIEQQLAKRLIDLVDLGLGETTGEGAVVFRQISQSEMASQVGARKIDSVKKVIGLLRAAGILATGRRRSRSSGSMPCARSRTATEGCPDRAVRKVRGRPVGVRAARTTMRA